jgi:outer membrane receptor protein involved in Fe transport
LIHTTPHKTNITKETNIYSGYIYSQFEITKQLTSILGLSYDNYSDGLTRKNQLNPKVGLTWNPTHWLTLRGAAFRTLKKPLATKQTIEPTQIAGFNQFFDGNNGTTAWNYGFGMDLQLSKKLFIGGELMWRDTTQTVEETIINQDESTETVITNVIKQQGRDESSHLAYLYWAPFPWAAFSSEYRFTEFRRDYTANNADPSNPGSVATHQVPLSLNFYHSSGLFSKFSGTFVEQNVEFVNERNGLDKDNSHFWIFNTVIGYRLPKRMGSLSLEVRNLFDNNNFKYHSEFDASGPQLTAFTPEREVFFKLNIAY